MNTTKRPIILIPDYRFADRVGLDNDPTGTFHKRCDIECKSLRGSMGNQKLMGERCIGCGYTVWIDPVNGGTDDKRDRETIWNATKQTEAIFNQFGIEVEGVSEMTCSRCGGEKERDTERAKSENPDDFTDGYTEFWVCTKCGDVSEIERDGKVER